MVLGGTRRRLRTDRHQLRPVAEDSNLAEAIKVVARAHKRCYGRGPVSWLMPRSAAWRCRYNTGSKASAARPWTQYLSAGKIATWLSKMTLQAIASVRVHDEFQSGSAGEARSWASAAVVIQLGGVRRHVDPRPLPPDGRDRHHRRCE